MRSFPKLLTFLSLLVLSIHLMAGNRQTNKTKEVRAKEFLNNQPLEFIENKGQFCNTNGKPADEVLFKASFGNCDIYITDKGLSYVFVKMEEVEQSEIQRAERIGNRSPKKEDRNPEFGEKEKEENKKVSYYRLDMDLVGANIEKSNILKEEESKQGHFNYFYAHCPEGIYDVKAYGKITIKNIYKGIDWVIYTNSDSKEHPLKYDFVVHPGADYKAIQIKFLNAQSTTLIDNDTKLKIQTIAGNIEEGNLFSYTKNEKIEVKSKYLRSNDSIISFKMAEYDTLKTLIIDPLVWATYYGGSGTENFYSMCIDNQDNVYITGDCGLSDFPLQQLMGAYWQSITAGYSDIFILKFNNHGVRQWATYYGGNQIDQGFAICSDSQNNIYITGYTHSPNFPTQQLSGAYWQSSIGIQYNAFILKFNNQGVRQWATYYGGYVGEEGFSICADSQDNIYVTGRTMSPDFPIQQLAGAYNQLFIGGDDDAFILKFNSQGQRQWATFYGGSTYDYGYSICVDSQDNIYITGETYSQNFPTQQLIGSYNQTINSGLGDIDAFILKFNNQGIRQWATYYGGNANDEGNSICVDSQDNIYITGQTNSSNFPIHQLAGAYWQATQNMGCVFILKFNNQGVRQWATYYGGNGGDWGRSICVDNQDNVYITGEAMSTNFPTQQLIGEYWKPIHSGGFTDAFILKFNNQGVRQWATFYGTIEHDCGKAIVADNLNSIYLIVDIGSSAYTKDYGNGAYYDSTWNGNKDGYILKITPCNNQKPTSLQSNRNNICINDNGNITLTALGGIGDTLKWYSGNCGQTYIGHNTSITIPSPTQTTTYYARWEKACGFSECDSIVIHIYSSISTAQNPIICQGETYSVGVHTYSSTGIYRDTISTISGCDSIITTNLIVNPIKLTTFNSIICQGGIVAVGTHIYSTAGIYKDTLTTNLGCDSIVTTNLIVNPIKYTILNPVICQGEIVAVGIHNYITTGVYSDTLTTFLGCDSIITTHLIVNPTKHTVLSPIICQGESYLVGTHTYIATGIYTDTLTTFLNCDSIITTNLIVNPIKQTTLNPIICLGEIVAVGLHIYTTTGTYKDTLTTYLGCDSIVTTNLTVNPIKQTIINPVICQGEKYHVGLHNYTLAGTYTDILTSYFGCDSSVTCNLTVKPLPIVNLGNGGEICEGDTIELSVNSGYTTYLWQDGSTNNSFVVSQAGTYWLMVNYNDCIKSDTVIYYVCPNDIKIWIPNSFTPNGDGLNDVFVVKTDDVITDFHLYIYNRWGQLIFETSDIHIGWDGKFKEKLCPDGVYVWEMVYHWKSSLNESVDGEKNGTITLIR